MGLMLGEFVDHYTVKVVDVFSLPQNGTGVSVESVDEEFQQQMLEMLKLTNRFFLLFLRLSFQDRDCCWVVPQSPWVWLLAVWG
jgi:hypothetical protein